jgi:hypothetical protein
MFYLSDGLLGTNQQANDALPTSSPDNYQRDYVRVEQNNEQLAPSRRHAILQHRTHAEHPTQTRMACKVFYSWYQHSHKGVIQI